MGLWSRTYVCCAVPLYNSGIYAILAQFTVVSIVTGVLCFAAPTIVSVSIPSFGAYVLGGVCILVGLTQIFGFLGVYREKPALFKSYARANAILVTIALLLALVWIILSAVRHSTGLAQCEALFAATASDTTINSGATICNIWTWVQIGIMGLLFLIVGLCEAYFLMFSSIYASEQRLDHARYNSVYSDAREEIRQSGLWDNQRPSTSDEFATQGWPANKHERQPSGHRNEFARPEPSQEYLHDTAEGRREEYYPQEERFDPPAGANQGYGYEADPYEQRYNTAGAGGAGRHQEEQYFPDTSHHQQQGYNQPVAGYASEPHWPQHGAEKARSEVTTSGNLGWDPAYHQR